MTLEDFQATRKRVENLNTALPDITDESETGPAYIYVDTLCIEILDGDRYHLIIGNWDTISPDLAALEAELHDFALSEGYCR
jgi:hypothetical protein